MTPGRRGTGFAAALVMSIGGALAAPAGKVQGASSKGEGVYMTVCASCHADGKGGAPRLGDKEAWQQRAGTEFTGMVAHASKGMQERARWEQVGNTRAMFENAIKGFQGDRGIMPAKGGNPALTDEEVSAAVIYMLEQAK